MKKKMQLKKLKIDSVKIKSTGGDPKKASSKSSYTWVG